MKPKFNYDQYDIGDWVYVTKKLYMVTKADKRERIDVPGTCEAILGRITGIKNFRLGKIEADFEGSAWFTSEGTITCWEIRTGLTNKPIYALPEYIKICPLDEVELGYNTFPILAGDFKNQWEGVGGNVNKKSLSEWSKEFPRDSKGRFKSWL